MQVAEQYTNSCSYLLINMLEALAQGVVPREFPFKFESKFDPGSPYSLVMALFPETVELRSGVFHLAETSQQEDLSADVAEFVKSECLRKGWCAPNHLTESESAFFYKVWLRAVDKAYSRVYIPDLKEDVDFDWINGIIAPLVMYRKLQKSANASNISFISLNEFETGDLSTVFRQLLEVPNPHWGIRQRLSVLVLPYMQYRNGMSILSKWLETQPLSTVCEVPLTTTRELDQAVVKACFNCNTGSVKLVQTLLDILQKNKSQEPQLPLLTELVQAALTSRFQTNTFAQLAEWTESSKQVQTALLYRYLERKSSFSVKDLMTLHKTVFSRLETEFLVRYSVEQAVRRAKFMFVTSIEPEFPDIVREVVYKVCLEYETNTELELAQVLTALDIVDGDKIKDLRRLDLERALKVQQTYNVDPRYVLSHSKPEILRKILEMHPRAYLKFSELMNTAADNEERGSVSQLCVDAALADDNFTAVQELIAILDPTNSECWIAYYQAGNYVSPEWEYPRSPQIIKKQLQYLSTSLSLCPESDILTVLRAWTELEKEARSAVITPVSSQPQPNPQPELDHKRTHISSLLKSGIGWAIGANQ